MLKQIDWSWCAGLMRERTSKRCFEWPSTPKVQTIKKTVGKLDFLQVCLQSETATGAVFLFINDFRRSLMTYRQSRGIAAVDG